MANVFEVFDRVVTRVPDAGRITVKLGGDEITVERAMSTDASTTAVHPPAETMIPRAANTTALRDNSFEFVTAPLVGVFYAAPAPDLPPFVKAGQRVRKGDPLCIIEAMKVLNEIESTYDGVIECVLAENGALVEYGQPLFSIKAD